jgi:ABC-type uncharacterized transport system auxiliary subunit
MIVRAVIAMAASVSVLLVGCALVSPPKREPAKALLSELPETVPHGRYHASVLVIPPPEAGPAYDTVRMAYSEQHYQLAYFRDHEWAEPPTTMIQRLLVRTLERTGAFLAVLTTRDTGRSAYTLRAELETLVQDYTRPPPVLRLVIRVELIESDGSFVASREFPEDEPLQERTPHAGVVAANAALARALQGVARFVVEQPR